MAQADQGIPPLEVSYRDDPQVLKMAAAEDYSLHAVPRSWRSRSGSLSMAWFGLMSAMFWVVVGSTATLAVGTVNTLIGIALSVIVYGLICGVASRYANLSGTNVALFSRALFGQIGATFAAGLFGLTITYYVIAEGSIVAVALHEYFGTLPMSVWYLIVVLYQAPLVLRGVRTWLDKISGALLPFYILGLIGSVVWAIVKVGYSNDWLTFMPPGGSTVEAPGWWYAFTVYMGVWVVVMMTWDYARFGRNEDARFNGRVSFGIPFYIITLLVNGTVGIFLVHTVSVPGQLTEASAIVAIVSLMGFWGAFWVWASQTRINTQNFFLSSSNWQNFFARAFKLTLPRIFWLAVVAVVVYLVMLTDVLTWILAALRFQGVVIVAWVAVVITHIVWSRTRGVPADRVEFRPGRVPLINPGGLTAWIVSALVGVVILAVGGTFGSIWAAPITCILAILIYAVSLQFARSSWFVVERPHDPRREVDDHWEARVRCHRCGSAYVAYEMDRDPARHHQPICLACASDHREFLRAARAEARTSQTRPEVPSSGGDLPNGATTAEGGTAGDQGDSLRSPRHGHASQSES